MEYKIKTMISYKIKYQTRRRESVSIWQGDWQDKEIVVVAGEDAREAVDDVVKVANILLGKDFRLRGVEIIGQVDIIVCLGIK